MFKRAMAREKIMKIADDLKKSHVEILEAIEDLKEEEIAGKEAIGKWSVRDVLLHIAMWDGEALKALAVWRLGHDYDWSYAKDYLRFNDFWVDVTEHLSVAQVLRLFNLVHSALATEVAAIPDDIWNGRGGVPQWLMDITINHYDEHLPKITAYRQSLGK
jgi:hypothetical protein